MKGVLAFAIPDRFAADFSALLHRFDKHPGCIVRTITDAALPPDLRPTFARLALGFPVVDPRRFDRHSD